MYATLMVPVDLAHADSCAKAVQAAADIGKLYTASVWLVGVTASAPSDVAHDPAEFAARLAQYADEQGNALGVAFNHKTILCNDPAVELDAALAQAGDELKVDLVVMASHVPGLMDHLFDSNAGELATHTDRSVFIVR